MKVKVGERIYDCNDTPIMVILTETDKENIASMLPGCDSYARFPNGIGLTQEDMLRWMRYGNM